jgi:hypothetical protein
VSSAGIEPAGRIFPLAFPRICDKLFSLDRQQQLEEDNMMSLLWVKVDLICETCCIIGIVLSIVVVSGFIQHGGLIMFITLLYYVLVQLGGVFYSFQWDTLLLETGFVVSLCSAPWLSSHYCHYTSSSNASNITTTSNNNKEVGRWPVRFLLFKLMFMSGVVKIQSDCPTWKHLTALEYHFATQCLPGPLAWYAHQMHPLLLRFGVAMTFLIEIPGAFLLICWNFTFRQVGAWMQILLQIMIIVTGNYNFFNVLTMLLCVSCLVDVVVEPETVELPEEKVSNGGAWIGLLLLVLLSLKKETNHPPSIHLSIHPCYRRRRAIVVDVVVICIYALDVSHGYFQTCLKSNTIYQ